MRTDVLDGVDRNGRYSPRIAEGEKRVERLVNHLDVWLEKGFQVTRTAAIRRLQAEVCPTPPHKEQGLL